MSEARGGNLGARFSSCSPPTVSSSTLDRGVEEGKSPLHTADVVVEVVSDTAGEEVFVGSGPRVVKCLILVV